MCRRKTNQYVGTLEGPELSSASHLSAESFDSQSIGTASVASHLSEAASGAGVAQVRHECKGQIACEIVQAFTLCPFGFCSTSSTGVSSHPASRLTQVFCLKRSVQLYRVCATVQSGSPNRPEKEKLRTPAWTDRVLWRSREATLPQHSSSSAADAPARQLAYSSVDSIRFSDHRPVRALFSMQVRSLS